MTTPTPDVGPSLRLSDADLDRLAQVDELDVLRVEQRWERVVKAWATNLLLTDVEVDDE